MRHILLTFKLEPLNIAGLEEEVAGLLQKVTVEEMQPETPSLYLWIFIVSFFKKETEADHRYIYSQQIYFRPEFQD